ncbi:MAG: MotA/TolQ/ExbB proton channel family protein, partial [bacterium]|nr:MotA/TolQ/ExbB proton channel family protein [bacterium]
AGVIRPFSAFSAIGRPDPNKLATGISEALINTAGGLAVAIVSIIAYNYFLAKMDKTSFIIEENSSEMIKILTGAETVY